MDKFLKAFLVVLVLCFGVAVVGTVEAQGRRGTAGTRGGETPAVASEDCASQAKDLQDAFDKIAREPLANLHGQCIRACQHAKNLEKFNCYSRTPSIGPEDPTTLVEGICHVDRCEKQACLGAPSEPADCPAPCEGCEPPECPGQCEACNPNQCPTECAACAEQICGQQERDQEACDVNASLECQLTGDRCEFVTAARDSSGNFTQLLTFVTGLNDPAQPTTVNGEITESMAGAPEPIVRRFSLPFLNRKVIGIEFVALKADGVCPVLDDSDSELPEGSPVFNYLLRDSAESPITRVRGDVEDPFGSILPEESVLKDAVKNLFDNLLVITLDPINFETFDLKVVADKIIATQLTPPGEGMSNYSRYLSHVVTAVPNHIINNIFCILDNDFFWPPLGADGDGNVVFGSTVAFNFASFEQCVASKLINEMTSECSGEECPSESSCDECPCGWSCRVDCPAGSP